MNVQVQFLRILKLVVKIFYFILDYFILLFNLTFILS